MCLVQRWQTQEHKKYDRKQRGRCSAGLRWPAFFLTIRENILSGCRHNLFI